MPDDIKPKENETTKEDHGKILASWTFPEFIKYVRTTGWYIGISIVIIGIIVYSILTKDYLFLIFIVIIVAIYYLRAKREPMLIKLNVTEDGLEVSDSFYQYKDIKNFWIIYEPPAVKMLYFDFKTGIRPRLSIFLENQNPLKIRKILLDYLEEDLTKENESFTDGMMRILKL